MKYKNVFIDLDRTLWDFEANSRETFIEIFNKYNLEQYCSFNEFFSLYRTVNDNLWKEYREGRISKDVLSWKRFYLTIQNFAFDNEEIAKSMGIDYVEISPKKTLLFPYTHELLKYLKSKYKLFIVTNGFKEVQYLKLKNCELESYFDKIYTSEEVGCNKPDRRFFEFVLEDSRAVPENSIVIGDDIEVDIKGAKNLNIDTIWFNTTNIDAEIEPTFTVNCLKDITLIL